MADSLSYLKTFYVNEIILADVCEQLFEFIFSTYIFDNFQPIWLFSVEFGYINFGNSS